MSKFIQLHFRNVSPERSDLLIAQLNEFGFSGFEEVNGELKAYIQESLFDHSLEKEISKTTDSIFQTSWIEETNWNELWESNFEPVVVDDFVSIRAHFHPQHLSIKHDLVITPKMSFGTGHHATTHMMIQQMRNLEFSQKTVLDFGTGTGVLAILAEKLGAESVIAIDNDDWSIENARENVANNGCRRITINKADTSELPQVFEIVLANINKNVITDNLQTLTKQLAGNGVLILSGLLVGDEPEIRALTAAAGLNIAERLIKDNWLSLKLWRG